MRLRDGLGLGEAPYLLCLGRVEDGKGTTVLARYFATYKTRRPGPLKLVLAGQVVQAPHAHDDIVVTGPVPDAVKWSLLEGSACLVQPSFFEAFSLVLMEGWSAGVPALVNGSCEALREHCRRSAGGLWFTGYASFEAAVDRLMADGLLRAGLAGNGRAYVADNFSWPAIIGRYRAFLEAAARRERA